MKRHDKAPNGHFSEGLILYGNLENGSMACQGFILEPPDLQSASIALTNEFQDKLRIFLATLGPKQRAQLQWTCNSDYQKELTRYHQQTGKVTDEYIRTVRQERFSRYWQRMVDRTLRREQLVLFISQDIETTANLVQSKVGLLDYYYKTLSQLRSGFDEMGTTLATIFGAGTTVRPMTDLEHFGYYKRFLNPSLADRLEVNFENLYREELSIQELCWDSDGVGMQDKAGFYLDGHYHSLFTIKRWPQKTYPGIVHRLTALPFLDYQITVNLEPIPVREEITREEKAIDRLRGDYEEEGKYSMSIALKKKERKIDSLAQGFSFPFYVEYFIRVWDRSETGLHTKCAAIKNAVNQMNGAQVYETALPTTAKKLFFSTWPGWTGSSYRHRDLYAEDRYLADLLPFSSTFTAHLEEAEAIYDGTNGNLAGVRTFNGGTPQHAVLIGMTGAGKSFAMDDLLTQTQAGYDYTVIIEEGLSYKKFTESLGGRPILIHPDGELTINYLDTQGLPLNQLQIASAVALVSKMIGESSDPEKQQLRQAQIGQYIHQLYSDTFAEWAGKHQARIPGLQRLSCAVHKWRRQRMGLGSTFLEAFAELRDRMEATDSEALDYHASISEGEITQFLKEPQTERFLMQTAYSAFTPEEYPTHSALLDLMFFSRLPEHRKEEIDQIATLLTAWTASGQYGKLFDGTTNISLTGKIAHFELGYANKHGAESNDLPASTNGAPTAPAVLPISLYHGNNQEESQVSDDYAPYGRMIPCETVITIDSAKIETPIIGFVTEDLWHDGKLIIPAGAEVHGKAQVDPSRERIASDNNWIIVWRTTARLNGAELPLHGVALDMERNETTGTWQLTDGSAGLKGDILKTDKWAEIKLFAATFLSAATTGLENTTTSSNALTGQTTQTPLTTPKNAALAGSSAVLNQYAQQILDSIKRDGFYVRVPAGKQFYLYVTQTIDLDHAKRGESLIDLKPENRKP